MVKFTEIEQFRHIISQINRYCNKFNKPLPKVTAKCTVKLHGTNGGVTYDNGKIYIQSRKNIITPEKDNAGFAKFVEERKHVFEIFFKKIKRVYDLNDDVTITIFGEFVGKGIQKGVGISLIEKSFFIFGIRITEQGEWKNIDENCYNYQLKETKSYWIPVKNFKDHPNRIYNIEDFETYEVEIDFNKPEITNNIFTEIVEKVENRCPVASRLLPEEKELIGEGIVCVFEFDGNRYIFKCKGEKHSKSKVKSIKKLTPEEMEKLNKIDKCVEEIFSPQRCNQFLTELFGIDFEKNIDIKKIGEYFKLVNKDIIKEEYDVLQKYGLEFKDIARKINTKNKEYFMGILNKL